MVRWDAPLFTVSWLDESVPGEEIWKAITEGVVKPPNAGTQAVSQILFTTIDICPPHDNSKLNSPSSMYLQVAKAPSDALRTLESTSSALVTAILAEQSASGSSGGPITVSYTSDIAVSTSTSSSIADRASSTVRIALPARTLTLSELQRHKRAFVTVHKKAITLGTVEKGRVDWDEKSVAEKFVRYLEENVKQ
jgi:protein KTI12